MTLDSLEKGLHSGGCKCCDLGRQILRMAQAAAGKIDQLLKALKGQDNEERDKDLVEWVLQQIKAHGEPNYSGAPMEEHVQDYVAEYRAEEARQ